MMATWHVRMVQMKRIVNVLPTSLLVRMADAFQQQLCVTEKTTALTEMTKSIVVSNLFRVI